MDDEMKKKLLKAATENVARTGEIEGRDLSAIDWPTQLYYGYDHANNVSQLCYRIGQEHNLGARDLEIVKAAGLYHDLGRLAPWNQSDPGHGQRSADLAHRFLRNSQSTIRDDVCQIIALHAPLTGTPPTDPRAIALWDADLLDAARILPGTGDGLRVMRERYTRLITPWSRLEEKQRVWQRRRGWK